MTRILIVDGMSGINASILAKLRAELNNLEYEVLTEPPPSQRIFTLPNLGLLEDLESESVSPYAADNASNKLTTASTFGGGAASGYNEFVASRGGKYGASKRRP